MHLLLFLHLYKAGDVFGHPKNNLNLMKRQEETPLEGFLSEDPFKELSFDSLWYFRTLSIKLSYRSMPEDLPKYPENGRMIL